MPSPGSQSAPPVESTLVALAFPEAPARLGLRERLRDERLREPASTWAPCALAVHSGYRASSIEFRETASRVMSRRARFDTPSPCSPTLPAGRRARTAFRSSAGGSTVASMPRQPGGCAPCSNPGLPTPARPSRACPMKPLPLNMATKGNVPLSRGTWTDTASPLRWPPRSSPRSRMVASCDPTR